MDQEKTVDCIKNGRAVLGIEFGSTRIKAVLIDEAHAPVASGSHEWENRLEDGIWTYTLDDIWGGLQDCYAKLSADVREKYGTELTTLAAIGFSGMMHGYMAFDREGKLLVPFRTWRNTITAEAAKILSETFDFNVPQRWSIAHLYQAVLNGEEHVAKIDYLSTLACYIHWKLTGRKAAGIGEASGMFPIDSDTMDYDAGMLDKFDRLENPGDSPEGACRGTGRGHFDGRGGKASGCIRQAAARHPAVSARGRCGHGNGRDKKRGETHRQRFCGDERVCDDRAGKGAFRQIFRDRHGNDACGGSGGDGALQ